MIVCFSLYLVANLHDFLFYLSFNFLFLEFLQFSLGLKLIDFISQLKFSGLIDAVTIFQWFLTALSWRLGWLANWKYGIIFTFEMMPGCIDVPILLAGEGDSFIFMFRDGVVWMAMILCFGLFQQQVVILLLLKPANLSFESVNLSSWRNDYLLKLLTDRLFFLICLIIY